MGSGTHALSLISIRIVGKGVLGVLEKGFGANPRKLQLVWSRIVILGRIMCIRSRSSG